MRRLALAIAVLLTCQAADAAGPPAWQDATSTEGGYTVQFPGKPGQENVNFPTDEGVAKMVRQYAEDARKNNYQAAHIDYPAAYVKRLTGRGVVKDTMKGMTAPFGAKVSAEKELTLGKHPGVEFSAGFRLKEVDITVAGRIYVVGDRGYMLLVMGRKGREPSAEEIGTFFKSFKLLTPAP
jgi:hypothetical protein